MESPRIVTLAILAGLAVVAGSAAGFGQPAREPIRIGLINEITGPLAVNEGIKLYWQDEMGNQVAGRPVRLIVEDTEGKPDVALTKCRKLVESDRARG